MLFFSDQHPLSLGGAQVSLRLQRKFLERAGHRVTIVSPRRHREHEADADTIDLASIRVSKDGEYSMFWPGRAAREALDRELATREPVDIVHVQGDFWAGLLGTKFARSRGLPLVTTLHNRLDVGIAATMPAPKLVARALGVWQRAMLGKGFGGTTAWDYLRGLAHAADTVIAPTNHFAATLRDHDVRSELHVIGTGVDDDSIRDIPLQNRDPSAPTRMIWIGRMSAEKRLLPFLQAVRESGVSARIDLVGTGAERKQAEDFVERHGLTNVSFLGIVAYEENLRNIARSDVLVQTSIGFETQGMTVSEAICLGTKVIVCDPAIAGELPEGTFWAVRDDSVEALAAVLRDAEAQAPGRRQSASAGAAGKFLQSTRTERIIGVYESVIERHRRHRDPRQ
ncbi:glycosyltransferase [Humidisolicoccus flavus]|uniref:glycosyltransferase n=1 Tax=Humidisolicoccus flavus TaxID=3111414 RepID=UPI00324B306E